MQERRILQFLSKEDIPTSAIIPSVNSYCNVIYVPVGVYPYDNTRLTLYNSADDNILYILNPFTVLNYNHPVTKSSYIRIYANHIYWLMYDDTWMTVYYVLGGYLTYSSNSIPIVLDQNGFLGYVKIKLSKRIRVYSYSNNTQYPFYIDTEE